MSEQDKRPMGDEHALSGSYALDAVDADERARYEQALAGSEQLREEAAGLADTAALLGSSVAPVTPPPALKDSIMAKLAGVPQLPAAESATTVPRQPEAPSTSITPDPAPLGTDASSDAAAATTVAAEPSGERSGSTSTASATSTGPAESAARRRWFSRPGAYIGAAAAAVVLIAVVIVGVNYPGPNGWGAQRELATISAASDAQQATAEVSGGGTVTLTWSEELGQSAVSVDGMPALTEEQTYQLWYIDSEAAHPAGTFTVGADGTTWRVLDGAMAAGDSVGVTVEPAGGSPQPTTTPVVVVPTTV
ncbi:anti-sigma factor domain-containing protein [Leifsonia sp. Leaf264]|uniref:anti-sigma factor n=1 Tax=Leifsonia sp. Leaf264 TaxID=1736314 RepID=UPI0006F35FBC|nr:anti-sigma factor [Leifsonia sp. Leaf264]KQO94487.1 hypothetical protein ASF30_21145 [Leifsonia sp. Leaf264]